MSSNYHRIGYFLLGFCTRFLFTNVYKKLFGIYYVLFRSWFICKNQKRPGFYTLTEIIFINNSRSKQNKKNPQHPFVAIAKRKNDSPLQFNTGECTFCFSLYIFLGPLTCSRLKIFIALHALSWKYFALIETKIWGKKFCATFYELYLLVTKYISFCWKSYYIYW